MVMARRIIGGRGSDSEVSLQCHSMATLLAALANGEGGTRRGVLVKGGMVLEALARVDMLLGEARFLPSATGYS